MTALARVVDLVVFDFDGTICDSAGVKTDAFHRLYLDDHGAEVAAAVRRHHLAHAGVSRYDKLRHYEEELLGRPCDDDRLERLAARFAALVVAEVIAAPLIPGAAEFLVAHAGSVPMCVASATPTAELREIVAAKGLDRWFAAVEGSTEPKGAILAGYVDRFGAQPGRTVMVGDQLSDHRAAATAGTGFVGVREAGAEPLFPEGTVVLGDLRGLEAALRAMVPAG